jgi:hypothetical protein
MLHLRTRKLTERLRADGSPDVSSAWNRNPIRTVRQKKRKRKKKQSRKVNPQPYLLATERGGIAP